MEENEKETFQEDQELKEKWQWNSLTGIYYLLLY